MQTQWWRWIWVSVVAITLMLSGCQPQVAKDGVTQLTMWHAINPPPNRDVFEKLVEKFKGLPKNKLCHYQ